MVSPIASRAIADAFNFGKALLKYITPNDLGLTGSHQYGYYLPRPAWDIYSPFPPINGENKEHAVKVLWQNGMVTDSCIKWYGVRTRSEFRLTRFGRDFPWLAPDNLGSLLILIPTGPDSFNGYVIGADDDLDEIQSALDIDIAATWARYDIDSSQAIEHPNKCIERNFQSYATGLRDFPATAEISARVQDILGECLPDLLNSSADKIIIDLTESEYQLFKLIERRLCADEIGRLFRSIDDFLKTASSIMNRRKSRAGRALENHVAFILKNHQIPFDIRPAIDGEPDIIIPSASAYMDTSYPTDKLFMLGIKTTCKDRWRQILNEATRIHKKHLFTLQPGISSRQIKSMLQAEIILVVPQGLHSCYPPELEDVILNFESFISDIKKKISHG
jgi:hypothetical protein